MTTQLIKKNSIKLHINEDNGESRVKKRPIGHEDLITARYTQSPQRLLIMGQLEVEI